MLSIISSSEENKNMKVGQLIQFKNQVPDMFLFFEKALCEVKANELSCQLGHTIKTN